MQTQLNQSERSNRNHAIKTGRLSRHYPAIGAALAAAHGKAPVEIGTEVHKAAEASLKFKTFVIEQCFAGSKDWHVIPETFNTADRAGDLEGEAVGYARKHEGTKIRIIRAVGEKRRAVKRFRVVNGVLGSYDD